MRNQVRQRGFSLIEVVVAVGIFAIAIVSVIGLLGPINKTVSDVRDFDDASRVVTAVQSALKDYMTFDQLSGFLPASSTTKSTALYADRSGDRIGIYNDDKWKTDRDGNSISGQTAQDAQKFFVIYLTRNTDLSPNSGSNPDTSAGFLAFTIELRWPAYTPDGTPISDTAQQSVMIVPAAITR